MRKERRGSAQSWSRESLQATNAIPPASPACELARSRGHRRLGETSFSDRDCCLWVWDVEKSNRSDRRVGNCGVSILEVGFSVVGRRICRALWK